MLFKFKKIVGCIEPWVKNRDENRIVSFCIVTALAPTHIVNNIVSKYIYIHFDEHKMDILAGMVERLTRSSSSTALSLSVFIFYRSQA
jgi:hypothetical protein